MDRPRILIPTNYRPAHGEDHEQAYLNDTYIRLVLNAGGLPVLVPPTETFDEGLAEAYAGAALLLTGGNDLDPSLYGQDRHRKATPLHPRREKAELAWFAWADRAELPILGICLGCQVINVARGGTLIQYLPDTPDAIDHGSGARAAFHDVNLHGPGLRTILGSDTCHTNSHHRQASDDLGDRLRVAGRAGDGVIEAVESTDDRFVLGLQWHPETLTDDGTTQAIMAAFVSEAARHSPNL